MNVHLVFVKNTGSGDLRWLAVQKKIQCGVDGGQQLDTEVVLFQEVVEPKNAGFVKRAHHARVQPRKFAVQRNITQGFLHRRVRQSKPLLQEVERSMVSTANDGRPPLAVVPLDASG